MAKTSRSRSTVSKKKASAKKASAKKASAKKASAKKASTKKASTKKASAKKASAKKASSKKASAKKASSKADEQLNLPGSSSAAADDTPPLRDPLAPGERVPDFSLEADDGKTYSRASLEGQRYVVYFYPRDNTPGCTTEACDFRDLHADFEQANVLVLGVSADSLKSHQRFRSKFELEFPLLSDPSRTTIAAFGALGEKKMYGRTSIGIIRSTFLVGPDGKVERAYSPVRVKDHAATVLQAVQGDD